MLLCLAICVPLVACGGWAAAAAEEESQAQVDEARAKYDAAKQLFDAEKYDEAKVILMELQASGVDLGSRTSRAIESMLTRIEKLEREAAEEEALQEALAQYEKAVNLYEEGRLEEARDVFVSIRDSGVSLGFFKNRRVRSYISKIDKEVLAAVEAEKRRAEEAEAAAERARQQEEEEAQARAMEAVLGKYESAVVMYKEGKLAEAKALFVEVRDSGVSLGRSTDKSLADYVAKIDNRLAEEAEAAKLAAERERARLAAAPQPVPEAPPKAEVASPRRPGLTREDREMQRRYDALMDELRRMEQVRIERDKFRAEELMTEGQALLDRYEYESALAKFEQALKLDPTLDEAAKKVALINEVLGRTPPSLERTIKELEDITEVRKQQARREIENAFAKAQKQYEAGSYADAEREFAKVVDMIDLLEVTIDMSKLRSDAERLGAKAHAALVEQMRREEAMRETEAIRATREAERAQREREEKVVAEILTDAWRYHTEGDYEKAEQACRAALDRDPGNFYAQALLDSTKAAGEEAKRKRYLKESEYAEAEIDTQNIEMEIPQSRVVTWPDTETWKHASSRKPYENIVTGVQAMSAMEKEVETALETPVLVEMYEEYLIDIIDWIALQTGVNIYVPSPLTSQQGELISDVEVPTFVMSDLPARVVLDELLKTYGLGYRVAAPRLLVVEPRGHRLSTEKLAIETYDVNDILVQVPTYGTDLVGVAAETKPLMTLQDVADLLYAFVKPESWSTGGGALGGLASGPGVINVRVKEGWLIIRQTPEVHAEIREFLAAYRQALGRMRFISLEAKLVELSDADIKRLGFGYDFRAIWNAALTGERPLKITPKLTETLSTVEPGEGAAFEAGVRATYNFVGDDIDVDIFLDFVTRHSTAKVVQVPRLTLVENQISYIDRTRAVTYIANVNPTVTENRVAYSVTLGTQSEGIILNACATISHDGRYVIMNIAPQFTGFTLNKVESEQIIQGDIYKNQVTVPTTSTTTMRTTAKVPDGGWLLLAGFSKTTRKEGRSGVPMLSRIPFLGKLFERTGEGFDTSTAIILLRPRVLLFEEYERAQELYGPIAASVPARRAGTL